MAVPISKLKKYLISRIDTDDLFEVEKVERYCELILIARRLEKVIKSEDLLNTTINGAQEFTKANPALSELKSINSQINVTGKSINFKEEIREKPKIIHDKVKKVSLI